MVDELLLLYQSLIEIHIAPGIKNMRSPDLLDDVRRQERLCDRITNPNF